MTTSEIAYRLVELCRKGEWEKAQKELYHRDIVSNEPKATGGNITRGLEAILKKNEMWNEMTDKINDWSISDPLIADGFFTCTMMMDVTLKDHGRIKQEEICIYEVKDGKIVSEYFFHN